MAFGNVRRIVTASLAAGLVALVSPFVATADARAAAGFKDVPATQQFYGDITWLVQHGISKGYSDDTFRPAAAVSRQAMVAFLYAFAEPGSTAPACASKPFPDVPTTSPFCPQITWAVKRGVTRGYTDGGFHPGSAVSRAAMASFLYALEHDGATAPTCTVSPFPADVAASDQFCGAIAWLARSGVADGADATHFRPGAPVSRQAMAAFLHRLAGPAPRSVNAHYVRADDTAAMTAAGRADAAADAAVSGTPLHLLDIGAQSTRAPLSASNPGVVLTTTSTRITYARLVVLVQAYVSGYTAAGGDSATVAVGTNSDGDWTAYPASTRAADWWNEVVQPLREATPNGIDVIGANDIEAGFEGTQSQVATWKSTFLSAASSVSGTALVYNG